MAGRQFGVRAAVIGGLCGTLPDLDVLVPYADPVAQMTYHRGWSHSLFWLTLISPLIAAGIGRFRVFRGKFKRLLVLVWLALTTHPILDAFTVYGTQLWRPFSETPVSIGSIFILDPVVTVTLIVGIVAALRLRHRPQVHRPPTIALGIVAAYLGAGVLLQGHMQARALQSLGKQDDVVQVKALPTPLNQVRWRLMAQTEIQFCDAFLNFWNAASPDWRCRSNGAALIHELRGHWPVDRLVWFSKGWVIAEVVSGEVIIRDVRMGIPDDYLFSFSVASAENGALRATDAEQLPTPAGMLDRYRDAYRHPN